METIERKNIVARETGAQSGSAAVVGIALVVALIHVLTNGRYGFHRDELQFLSDARHLDWGYVAYPPFTPIMERIGLEIFGLSLVGLRLFSVIAQACAIVVTAWMARELGGGRLAQVTTALVVATSGLPVFEGTEFQYSTFDYLWWVLVAYFMIRMLKTDDLRWWLAIGAALGLGLQTKYSICFYIAGILGGMLLTSARRYFLSGWFWGGVGVALLIFLPNLLWQVRHGFISYHFLQHIHVRDVGEGRANGFWRDQFLINTNMFVAPIWIAGVVAFLMDRQYRILGWMYVIPVLLFFFGKGRGYYVAPAYPMLFAMGAVVGERWVGSMRRGWRLAVEGAWAVFVYALIVPLATSGPLKEFALKNNGDLREEFGWDELVKTVAGVRDSLPPEQRNSLGVFVGNYGEQGAVEILGRAYGLPMPISLTNSAWLRGYPVPTPSTLIVIGFSQAQAEKTFTSCRWARHNGNSEGVKNEESEDHPDIFVCGPPKLPWGEFWRTHERYG